MLKKNVISSRGHLFTILFCLILIPFHPAPPLIASITGKTGNIKLYKRTWKTLDTFLNRYKGTSFNKVVSIGGRRQFYNALTDSVIVIDKTECEKRGVKGVAEHDPGWGDRIILKYDPAKIPASERKDFNITLWHETVHLIEFKRGDTSGDTNWKERHAEFLEAMVKNVLDPLMELEIQANNQQFSDRDLQSKWAAIVRGFEQGAKIKNSKYPHPPILPSSRNG